MGLTLCALAVHWACLIGLDPGRAQTPGPTTRRHGKGGRGSELTIDTCKFETHCGERNGGKGANLDKSPPRKGGGEFGAAWASPDFFGQ